MERIKKIKKSHIIAAILIFSAILAGILFSRRPEHERITYNQFIQAVEEGRIEKVYLDNSEQILGEYKSGETFITDNPRTENFKEFLLVQGIIVDEVKEKIQEQISAR